MSSMNEVKEPSGTFLLTCREVFDGHDLLPKANLHTILVADSKIAAIDPSPDDVPSDAVRIDLSRHFVMPGLIDCHAHPVLTGDDYQFNHLRMSSAMKSLIGLKACQGMLDNGWTTVRVAGDADPYYPSFAVKQSIDSGLFVGPTILGAGHYITITGGGGDINTIAPEQCHCITPDGRVVDGVDEMRKAVREEVKFGSDWIKLLVSGAYCSSGDSPFHVHFSDEEIKTAVTEAARFGKHVMAHAHAAEAIKSALRCGVKTIEHGSFIDEEGIDLMIERKAYLVPTLYIGEHYEEQGTPSGALNKMLEIQRESDARSQQCLRAAIAHGVKVAVGTDFIGWDPALNYKELVCLEKLLHMKPIDVLRSATEVGAELLERSNSIGRLHVGMTADIIAVRCDATETPLESTAAMSHVDFVMKNGRVVRKV